MKLEFKLAILLVIICNLILGYMFYTISEVPFWAFYIFIAMFNIAAGMVLMNYLIEEVSEND